MELTITKVGEAFVLILPPDMLHYLGASEGDTIHFTETENGFRLAAHDADSDRAMKYTDLVMAKYDSALRSLAE